MFSRHSVSKCIILQYTVIFSAFFTSQALSLNSEPTDNYIEKSSRDAGKRTQKRGKKWQTDFDIYWLLFL